MAEVSRTLRGVRVLSPVDVHIHRSLNAPKPDTEVRSKFRNDATPGVGQDQASAIRLHLDTPESPGGVCHFGLAAPLNLRPLAIGAMHPI